MINKYFLKQKRIKYIFVLFLAVMIAASLFYIRSGVVDIAFCDIVRIILSKVSFLKINTDGIEESKIIVIEMIRVPRLISALLIGGGLAVSGLFLQGLFRNKLVDPYITGVSAGATLGATIAILFGLSGSIIGLGGIIVSAFAGSILTMALIFVFISFNNYKSSSTILLIGISITLFFSGIVSLLMFLNKNKIESIVLWTMGSIADPSWNKIIILLPVMLIGIAGLFFCSKFLDVMIVDEDTAKTHGINTGRIKLLIIFFTSLITASCVSFCGIIGFVGLIIPDIMRMLFGYRHKTLILFSFVSGSILLIFSDLAARTILSPAELPVGIVTALLGVPVFLLLLLKNKKVN